MSYSWDVTHAYSVVLHVLEPGSSSRAPVAHLHPPPILTPHHSFHLELDTTMKLKDIARTATFAWDQTSSSAPLLVTGAVAGALDESFSNESQLEIWAPDFGEGEGLRLGGAEGKGPLGSITVSSRSAATPQQIQSGGADARCRFNRLAWSAPSTTHTKGVIAAGMETGEVHVYDPEKIIAGKRSAQLHSNALRRADGRVARTRVGSSRVPNILDQYEDWTSTLFRRIYSPAVPSTPRYDCL